MEHLQCATEQEETQGENHKIFLFFNKISISNNVCIFVFVFDNALRFNVIALNFNSRKYIG